MSHKKEIFKCHHQAPLWNQSFVIYCVPSGTCNSSCSAGLEYFQLGCPAERHITSPCQFESFSVEMLEVEEEFSFLSGCHPGSCTAEDNGKKQREQVASASACQAPGFRDTRVSTSGTLSQPPPAPSGHGGDLPEYL